MRKWASPAIGHTFVITADFFTPRLNPGQLNIPAEHQSALDFLCGFLYNVQNVRLQPLFRGSTSMPPESHASDTAKHQYKVERRLGCIIVWGSVPIGDMASLASSFDETARMDLHLASLMGATFVIGYEDRLDEMRNDPDLPLCPKRLKDAEHAETAGMPSDFIEWLRKGNRGSSSNYIAHAITGVPAQAELAHPRDSSDLHRCIEVIQTLKDYRHESDIMEVVKTHSDCWAALSGEWSKLRDLCSTDPKQCNLLIRELEGLS